MADKKERPIGGKGNREIEKTEPPAQPAEEWGQGFDQGKAVGRGGKSAGHVPGAHPDPGQNKE